MAGAGSITYGIASLKQLNDPSFSAEIKLAANLSFHGCHQCSRPKGSSNIEARMRNFWTCQGKAGDVKD